jgi:NTP pyrophosphatase (non-canonical NTP hydrolase)
MADERTAQVLGDVYDHRVVQDAKWGEQNHDPAWYFAILMEEVGELAMAIVEFRWGDGTIAQMREEAIHSAAVAVAIVERLDRMEAPDAHA